jgi:hypothetical protein
VTGGRAFTLYPDRIKIALTEDAKEVLIERDKGIFKEGQMNNDEVGAVIDKIRYALRIAEETASDYERLAKELKETDPASYLEFASMAAGIREATVNLRTILLEQPDGKQD